MEPCIMTQNSTRLCPEIETIQANLIVQIVDFEAWKVQVGVYVAIVD